MLVCWLLFYFINLLAPPVEDPEVNEMATPSLPSWTVSPDIFEDSETPRKKKYAKESWPGKKPAQLIV